MQLTHPHTHQNNTHTQPEEGGPPQPMPLPCPDPYHLTMEQRVERQRELIYLRSQVDEEHVALTAMRLGIEVEQFRTFEEAMDLAPSVMVVMTRDINYHHVLYINKTVTTMLGYDVEMFLGQ